MRDPSNTYLWKLAGNLSPPDPGRLRAEDPTRPGLGELLPIGSVIRTDYGTGPYRVSKVTKWEAYPGVFCWSVVGHEVVDGVATKGGGYGIMNEYVVEWSGDTPRFRKLFVDGQDEILLVAGKSYVATRNGQLELF